jgi:adenylate cyclase class 2
VKSLIEVEIKVKIENPDKIVQSLKKLGGVYLLSLEHHDTYFNMPRKLRDFRRTDEALRIRKSKELNKNLSADKERQVNYFLTYKGAKIDSQTKTREEHEIKFENGDELRKILNILNFREIITIEKHRELYELNYKNNKIECLIDYLPFLEQNFLELEIVIEGQNRVSQKTDLMFDFLQELGISKNDSIRKSYLELIVDKLKKK